jgi:hypothetical protein
MLEEEACLCEEASLARVDAGAGTGGSDAFALDAEAFRVAIAVLNAVATKGERLASGDALQLYGEVRIKR